MAISSWIRRVLWNINVRIGTVDNRRWVLAFSVWVLAALIAAAVAVIVVKFRSNSGSDPDRATPGQPTSSLPTPSVDQGPSQGATVPGSSPAAAHRSRDNRSLADQASISTNGKIMLCPGVSTETATLASDGTLLGHEPYPDAPSGQISSAPTGFGGASCSRVHSEAKIALERLIAAATAEDPKLGSAMVGLSCFRPKSYQKEVFCRKVSDGFAVRARSSAPPGFSEHATGYAIDFGDRNHPNCNLNPCFASTPVGTWLFANAREFGFELSFPSDNTRGIMYEPWHWRYVGSARAKKVFARAH